MNISITKIFISGYAVTPEIVYTKEHKIIDLCISHYLRIFRKKQQQPKKTNKNNKSWNCPGILFCPGNVLKLCKIQ